VGFWIPLQFKIAQKFLVYITNALLQSLKDIVNGICYQRYEKHLEQQKGRPMLMFALQKKIWKRNYN